MSLLYSPQSIVGGATASLRVQGNKGAVAIPGLFLPGQVMPGQIQYNIQGKIHFKTTGGTDVKTIQQGDVVGIEFDVTDGNGAGFALATTPTLVVKRQDGTLPTVTTPGLEYQGNGVYYGAYQSASSEPLGPLTLQVSGTLPDGTLLLRTENVEIVAAEAA